MKDAPQFELALPTFSVWGQILGGLPGLDLPPASDPELSLQELVSKGLILQQSDEEYELTAQSVIFWSVLQQGSIVLAAEKKGAGTIYYYLASDWALELIVHRVAQIAVLPVDAIPERCLAWMIGGREESSGLAPKTIPISEQLFQQMAERACASGLFLLSKRNGSTLTLKSYRVMLELSEGLYWVWTEQNLVAQKTSFALATAELGGWLRASGF